MSLLLLMVCVKGGRSHAQKLGAILMLLAAAGGFILLLGSIGILSPSFLAGILKYNPAGWWSNFYWRGWLRNEAGAWKFAALALTMIATLPSTWRAFRRIHDSGAILNLSLLAAGPAQPPAARPPAADKLTPASLPLDAGDWDLPGPVARAFSALFSPEELTVVKSYFAPPRVWLARFAVFLVCVSALRTAALWNPTTIDRSMAPAMALLLFAIAIWRGAILFCWGMPILQVSRLMPVPRITFWKTFTKFNVLVFLLLFPLAELFSHGSLPAKISFPQGILSALPTYIAIVACLTLTFSGMIGFRRAGPLGRWAAPLSLVQAVLPQASLILAFPRFLPVPTPHPGVAPAPVTLTLWLLFLIVAAPLALSYAASRDFVGAWRRAAAME